MTTENKNEPNVTTAPATTPPPGAPAPGWMGNTRPEREPPTVPLPVYTRDRSQAERRGIKKGAEQAQRDLLGRFQVGSVDELQQLIERARRPAQVTPPPVSAPSQAAPAASPPPVQGVRETDAAYEARLAAFEKRQQEWEEKAAAREKAEEERWAKLQAAEEERLRAIEEAEAEAAAEAAYETEWARWQRHAADLKVPSKNQPLLRAYAERFVSNIDPAVEAEFDAVPEGDEAGLRKLWEKHFYDPLRGEYPFLFAEAQPATTGATPPAGLQPTPGPAEVQRQALNQNTAARIGDISDPLQRQAATQTFLRKLGVAPV